MKDCTAANYHHHVARCAVGLSVVAAAAVLAILAILGVLAVPAALGSAEPVGPLPKGPGFQVKALRGATFVIRAPKRPASSGLVWRVARQVNANVVRQVGEGEDRLSVWLRFRAVGVGTTKVVLALTRGETRKAYAARTWVITVRKPMLS